jgi:transposase-like protein
VDEICRRHGISSATFYTWRKKYGGMEASDARRLACRQCPLRAGHVGPAFSARAIVSITSAVAMRANRSSDDFGQMTPWSAEPTLIDAA